MNDTTFTHASLIQQLDSQLVQQAMALIEPARRIALLAHEHPDGDCIGSALGFAHILCAIGKSCIPVCVDAPPRTLSFLAGIETLETSLSDEQFDLVIALDAGEITRFGSLYSQHQKFLDRIPILNIDHHISSSGCGVVNIIDPLAAATAELITLFQQQTKLPLSQDAAQCLLTGVITDTNSFQYTSTTPRTLEVGAVLLQAGALPEIVAKSIYRTRPIQQVRFQAAVIANMQTACAGRLVWSYATPETLQTTGATAEMDDNFSGMLRDIEGVQIAAFFKSYDDANTTSLSLRCAAPYNAAEICVRFGGGGHARAAGATIHKPYQETMADVIAILKQEIASKDII
jgi:bifunctional oligoribonuclease and PAP phosphatase NrnA